ncbi:hypothetical protein IFM89_014679 [Coptis chinensis]|uniref:Terpene synthase N-terminal domain-containing protein n=1 Tax=Coptis chinensis TaxID=261450 RepID=A0A835HPY8_9MAGN|nr:hypothetical protein IFM89_014679 [Coptis chinensis]
MVQSLIISSAETEREVMKTHHLNFCTRLILVGPKRLLYDYQDVIFVALLRFFLLKFLISCGFIVSKIPKINATPVAIQNIDVFNCFKDDSGQFKSSLHEDIKGMLSFNDASHFAFEGEDILDEAKWWKDLGLGSHPKLSFAFERRVDGVFLLDNLE